MRIEIARLHGIIDRITEESAEYRKLMDMARTEDAGRFAAIVARIIEMGAAGLCTVEDVRRELGAARMDLRAASGSHNPEDLRRIGELEAKVRMLEAMIKYYEMIWAPQIENGFGAEFGGGGVMAPIAAIAAGSPPPAYCSFHSAGPSHAPDIRFCLTRLPPPFRVRALPARYPAPVPRPTAPIAQGRLNPPPSLA